MGMAERRRLREVVATLRQNRRTRLDRMPEETAQEYIDHYDAYGWEHFTREHCPAHLYTEVEARFMATAYVDFALSQNGLRRAA